MPDPTFTEPPVAPTRASPSTFVARANAFIAWFATFYAELVAAVTWFAAQVAAAAASATAAANWATSLTTFTGSGGLKGARGYAQDAEASAGVAADEADAAAISAASAAAAPGTQATCSDPIAIPAIGATVAFELNETGKLLGPGQAYTFASDADVENRFTGILQAGYDSATGEGELEIVRSNGSGTHSDWIVGLAPDPLGDVASQAEAEAGVVNDKAMTPLRGAQQIAALAARSVAIVQQQRSSGTIGSALALNAFGQVSLDTETHDPDGLVTLSSGDVVIAEPGEYEIEAWSSAFGQGAARARLFDVGAAAVIATGPNAQVGTPAGGVNSGGTPSVTGVLTVTTTKTVRLLAGIGPNSGGGGASVAPAASNIAGVVEVYGEMIIRKKTAG